MFDREHLQSLLERGVFGNSLLAWATALGTFVVALLVLSIVRRLVVRRARRMYEKERRPLGGFLLQLAFSVSWLAVLAIALKISVFPLVLTDRAAGLVHWIIVLALAWQAAIWAGILVEALIDLFVSRRAEREGVEAEALSAFLGIFRLLVKILVYTVVVLVALDNLGVDITALIAGLGVGGIAIALAVQSIVGDLFSSMSIVLDKPFVLGDFIIVDDKMGTVERIGIKTTRIRSLSGEELVFGNSDLLSSRIRNYKRMRERRIVFQIGVTYQTPRAELEAIPKMIREIVEAQEKARFDRSHFKGFGAYSLDFETVYYVTLPDYNSYMDVQQAMNLEIHRRFEERGIEFAFPTQTLFLSREARRGEQEKDGYPASS